MTATKSENPSAAKLGTEIRCQNTVLKSYDGAKKLKVCNSLLAVVELNVSGEGSATYHTKCGKCKQMTHHTISK